MNAKQAFTEAYRRTLAATGGTLSPDHFEECWRVVAGIPASVFEAAATKLNASCRFLPRASEWLDACKAIEGERYMARVREQSEQADTHRRDKTYHCLRCHDSGMETDLRCTADHWCDPCKFRGTQPYPHTYARKCECRHTNPTYQDYIERLRKQTGPARAGKKHEAAA
jgi:hypothetical protein